MAMLENPLSQNHEDQYIVKTTQKHQKSNSRATKLSVGSKMTKQS